MYSEKTPDDGQRNSPKRVEFHSKNKFEKLVHIVGFIIRQSRSTGKVKSDSAALSTRQNGFPSEKFSFPNQTKINFVTARPSCNYLKSNLVEVSELQIKQRPEG
jgi:hypothetical protein